MKGIIISIEGTDGAGKHTQQQLLAEDLKKQGFPVFEQSFPNYDSPSASPVKMYLGGEFGNDPNCLDAYQASTLYATDRLATYKKDIEPHYNNGEIILFDRYVQSNFIHQCSKITDEKERQKFLNWNREFEFKTLKLPEPDLVFFIEMPPEKSLELARARGELKAGTSKDIHEQEPEYLARSYNNGLSLANQLGWNLIHCVDENGNVKTREAIHEEIMKVVKNFFEKYISENANTKFKI